MDKRIILQLCADTGSDTWPYRNDPKYEVITVGSDVGVENYHPDREVHGIIANPVCLEFSQARRGAKRASNPEEGLKLVRECQRIIEEANPKWWALENPATGTLRNYLGKPDYVYQPWWFGSPWNKKTALWGQFKIPERTVWDFNELSALPLWIRKGRNIPSLAFQHKGSFQIIPEFRDSGMPVPKTDSEFRSLCSQRFAKAFKIANP